MPRVLQSSKVYFISTTLSDVVLISRSELASHDHVLEVSVVARMHPKWGERPMAFVILHPEHAPRWAGRHHEFAEELKVYAKTRLPGFACPEWVEVVPELPVSCHLRIQRRH
jgi:acyl-coenzyme A synthetase/AMP-(fatty) acid ligase